MGLGLQEYGGFLVCFGVVGEDGDISVWMEAVDDACAGGDAGSQAFVADGNAAVGTDFQSGACAPDVRPPWATRDWTQGGAIFTTGFVGGGIRSAAQFAMDFLGIAMAAQGG